MINNNLHMVIKGIRSQIHSIVQLQGTFHEKAKKWCHSINFQNKKYSKYVLLGI